MNSPFTTPILLILFKRPEAALKIIDTLRALKPSVLYIAADAPRPSHPEELERCEAARNTLLTIDWPCRIERLFAETNRGVDTMVPNAITWMLSKEECGIILEDDCLPCPDFYVFCSTLLEQYASHKNIFMISGNNFQDGNMRGDATYYVSQYPSTWGWATWKRAWDKYDHDLSELDSFIHTKILKERGLTTKEERFWNSFFTKVRRGKYTFWDTKWAYAMFKHNGLALVPNYNLIQNVGFDADATHVIESNMSRTTQYLPNPIVHPKDLHASRVADLYLFSTLYYKSFWQKAYYHLKRIARKL